MKKKLLGKVGCLYRLAQRMTFAPDGVLPARSLPVGTVLMIVEKRKAIYSITNSNVGVTDYKVLTTDGEVGWIGCIDRWFRSDFKKMDTTDHREII